LCLFNSCKRQSFDIFAFTSLRQKQFLARLEFQAEDLRRHKPSGTGSSLCRKRLAATPTQRRRLSADRGHLQKSLRKPRGGRFGLLYQAIPNAASRQHWLASLQENAAVGIKLS
jgi:hypothetical protein